MSRAKPTSAESSPGGLLKSSVSATAARAVATSPSTRRAPFRRRQGERFFRGVDSMPVFYPPDRGDVLPLTFFVPVPRNLAADLGEPCYVRESTRDICHPPRGRAAGSARGRLSSVTS